MLKSLNIPIIFVKFSYFYRSAVKWTTKWPGARPAAARNKFFSAWPIIRSMLYHRVIYKVGAN